MCTDQLQLYERALGELTASGEQIFGVSCDSSYAQSAFREKLGVSIPQLSDFEPKGAACGAFGVLHEGGFPQRALVVIGPDGVVQWSYQGAHAGGAAGRRAAPRGPGASRARRRGLIPAALRRERAQGAFPCGSELPARPASFAVPLVRIQE